MECSDALTNMEVLSKDIFENRYTFCGLYNESDSCDLNRAKMTHSISYYSIDLKGNIWCQYLVQLFKFYKAKSYQTAFLFSLISFESMIDLIIDKTAKLFEDIYNETIDVLIKIRLNQGLTIRREDFEYYINEDECYTILKSLENKNRDFINKMSFFNLLRNCLSHGNGF